MTEARGVVRRAVGASQISGELLALVELPGRQYVDAFVLEFDRAREWTAEQWARAMFEDDRPLVVRAATRGLLGVMLSRPDPRGTIGGYTIARSDPEVVRADLRSTLSHDQVVVSVSSGCVALVTAVRSRSALGRIVWKTISPLHRSFAPRVLRYAAARSTASRHR